MSRRILGKGQMVSTPAWEAGVWETGASQTAQNEGSNGRWKRDCSVLTSRVSHAQTLLCVPTDKTWTTGEVGGGERGLSSFTSVRVGSGGEEILVERLWVSHRIPRDMEELAESRGGHIAASRELQHRAWKPHLSLQEANLNIRPASESVKPRYRYPRQARAF